MNFSSKQYKTNNFNFEYMKLFYIIDNTNERQVARMHALNGMHAIIRYCNATEQEIDYKRFIAIA